MTVAVAAEVALNEPLTDARWPVVADHPFASLFTSLPWIEAASISKSALSFGRTAGRSQPPCHSATSPTSAVGG